MTRDSKHLLAEMHDTARATADSRAGEVGDEHLHPLKLRVALVELLLGVQVEDFTYGASNSCSSLGRVPKPSL